MTLFQLLQQHYTVKETERSLLPAAPFLYWFFYCRRVECFEALGAVQTLLFRRLWPLRHILVIQPPLYRNVK